MRLKKISRRGRALFARGHAYIKAKYQGKRFATKGWRGRVARLGRRKKHFRGRGKRRFGKSRRWRRGRRGHRRSKQLTLSWTTHTQNPPVTNNGISLDAAYQCPTPASVAAGATDGRIPLTFVCEAVSSGAVGYYNFNFTRLFYGPMASISQYFQFAKIHGGGMSIRRIDSGANSGVMTSEAGGFVPFSYGTAATRLRVYYRFCNGIETSQADFNTNRMLADSRTKCRWLMPGRKLTFRFAPRASTMRSVINLFRTYNPAAANGEQDRTTKMDFPSRGRKLGWIPVGALQTLDSGTSQFSGGTAGIRPGINDNFDIIAPTLMILFDWDGQGPFTRTYAGQSLTYSPFNPPQIARKEWCRFSIRGLRLQNTLQPGIINDVGSTTFPLQPASAGLNLSEPLRSFPLMTSFSTYPTLPGGMPVNSDSALIQDLGTYPFVPINVMPPLQPLQSEAAPGP